MKNLTVLIVFLLLSSFGKAQFNIQFSSIEDNGSQMVTHPRVSWSVCPFPFHIMMATRVVYSGSSNTQAIVSQESFGISLYPTFQNHGIAFETNNVITKDRAIAFGIPIAIYFTFPHNNGNSVWWQVGPTYDFYLNIHHKKKVINGTEKVKTSEFFSDEIPLFQQSLGIAVNMLLNQGRLSAQLKFYYNLNSYFNKNYEQEIDGILTKPYKNFKTNIFGISLLLPLFAGG